MLSSITPLGERGRANRWWLTVTAFVIGSLAGGALIGAALGAVGGALQGLAADDGTVDPGVPLGLLAVAALAGALVDLGVGGARVPGLRRQVDERWLDSYRGWVYGVGYGFQLGTGVVTIITSAATWVVLVAALLTGSLVGGLVVGAVFGLARSLPLFLTARVRHAAALRDLHFRNQRWAAPARVAAVGGQGLVGVGALLLLLVTT